AFVRIRPLRLGRPPAGGQESLDHGTGVGSQGGGALRPLRAADLRLLPLSARRRRLESPEPLAESAAAPAAERGDLVDLTAALHALPLRQRRALVLREWQGLDYAEIAERLGLTKGAVETLLHRARRSLRAAASRYVSVSFAEKITVGTSAS